MKRALLIGICYEKTNKKLLGTKNDIKMMYELLISWGFSEDNIIVSADTSCGITKYKKIIPIPPTTFGINMLFNRFVTSIEANDKVVIFYTGHGMLMRDKPCIVPIDYTTSGPIGSETIRYYLNKISKDVNVLTIFDCCRSGTICDLKYHKYDTSYKKDVTQKIRRYNAEEWIIRQVDDIKGNADTDANIITISGCWDDQVSYDLVKNGALTMTFLDIIKKYGVENLQFDFILQYLRGGIITLRLKQTPQITTGRDTDLKVTIKDFMDI